MLSTIPMSISVVNVLNRVSVSIPDRAQTLLEIIKGRRSIRRFKPEKVPKEYIMLLLEAARWAPSAGNLQPWEFIIVTDESTKRKLMEAALYQEYVYEAPVVIVAVANIPRTSSYYGRRGEELYVIQDVAAAIQNILLMAHALGLGAVWIGAFNEDRVREILELPNYIRPLAIIPLGWPDEKPYPPPRRSLEEIVHWEKY